MQELCDCTLGDYLKENELSEEAILKILEQLFSAVEYCHGIGIIHRDIKLQNLMLADREDISSLKIIDFGLSTRFSSKNLIQASGTAIYLAPEVISGVYNQKADVWSMGVLIYYLLVKQFPFTGDTPRELYESILKSRDGIVFPEKIQANKYIVRMVEKMLSYNPDQRISASDCLKIIKWLQAGGRLGRKAEDKIFKKKKENFFDKIKQRIFTTVKSDQVEVRVRFRLLCRFLKKAKLEKMSLLILERSKIIF